ncbi:MAG TPA: peptidoglycan-binding protein LysM [Longimicrobiales bacterium]|nr:peptidoglycan-binding protein LysM [Longimicrobiales bacterium]
MGIFDFIKDVGEKLTGRDDDKGDQDEALDERRKGNTLMRHVMALGLEVENLRVDYDDGVATVTGKAADQATRERAVLAIGNTEGVAQVDDRMTVDEDRAEAKFYTVQKGDSLSKIAKEHYGDAMKYPAIFEANKPMLKDPDKIYPGQVLRLPELDD